MAKYHKEYGEDSMLALVDGDRVLKVLSSASGPSKERYEIVVWVNQEGSVTTKRGTIQEALEAAMDIVVNALACGWKINGVDIKPVTS